MTQRNVVVLAAAQFLVMLSINSTVVAFPVIGAELAVPPSMQQFVVTAYALMFGSLLLLAGRAGDVWGRRRVLLVGLVVFVAGALVGVLAAGGGWVVAARAVQGIGAAAVATNALALLTALVPAGPARDRALGVFGAATATGAAVGIVAGGALVATVGWRAIFVLVGVLAAVLLVVVVRELPPSPGPSAGQPLDWAGGVLATLGVAGLAAASTDVPPPAVRVGLLVTGAATLVAFVLVERRQAVPLLPLRIFRLRSVSANTLATVLVWAAFASMFFHLSLVLQDVLNYSPTQAALAYLPLAAATTAVSPLAGPLLARFGATPVAVAGALAIAAGSLLLGRVEPGAGYLTTVLPGLLVAGIGVGAALVALQSAVFADVPERDAGAVAGLFTTAQEVASALGTAAFVAVALTAATTAAGLSLALTSGAATALAGAALLAVLGTRRRRAALSGRTRAGGGI